MHRINKYLSLLFLSILLLAFTTPAIAATYKETIELFNKSEAVQPFFKNSYGYAVFPIIGKGGLFIGGAFGKGQVYKNGTVTGETSLIKASIGFQLGGQAFSEIIFFKDKRAYDKFTSGSFEFDATASAVVITAGVRGSAGTTGSTAGASAGPATGAQANSSYYGGMATFVHIKGGLMYEAAIGGQKFSFKPKPD